MHRALLPQPLPLPLCSIVVRKLQAMVKQIIQEQTLTRFLEEVIMVVANLYILAMTIF